jgi:hypothetical protein
MTEGFQREAARHEAGAQALQESRKSRDFGPMLLAFAGRGQ